MTLSSGMLLATDFGPSSVNWAHPRTNGGPGCSSLEGSFKENGVSGPQLILTC